MSQSLKRKADAIDAAEALRVSNAIDEELRWEAARRKKLQERQVKVMLLGQAESGKSTLQKQFQLLYAASSLDHERPSWRPVVFFNVIKAIRMIVDELNSPSPIMSPGQWDMDVDSISMNSDGTRLSEVIIDITQDLQPLIQMEDKLASGLSGGIKISGGKTGVFVRDGWQSLLSLNHKVSSEPEQHEVSKRMRAIAEITDQAAAMLVDMEDSVLTLWDLPVVKAAIAERRLRLDEAASYLLTQIPRLCSPNYLPTNTDILSVRLQTLGVSQYSYEVNLAGTKYNWLMYDVGGARGQRHSWVPFFDNATAIIFLVPISAFDQYLEEDHRTNRIDDSLQLFTLICGNKLLKSASLVLMLNKADLLRTKLEAGIAVRRYITSFGDRENTYDEVSQYFLAHFIQIHRRKDIGGRPLYAHFTSMLDVTASQAIIANVGAAIIRSYIKASGLL